MASGQRTGQRMTHYTIIVGSFDAFMWQALETEARYIAQVMAGEGD